MTDINLKDTFRALIISLLLIILGQTPIVIPFKNVTSSIIDPLQYGFYTLGLAIEDQWQFLSTLKALKARNLELEQEIENLRSQISELKDVKRENEVLRGQLGVESLSGKELLKGSVIGYGSSQSLIKLNIGSSEDVQEGAVVVFNNYVVGEVIDVQSSSSFVRLITDVDSKLAALDQDSPNRARGIVRGQYATTMIMEKIFQEEQLEVGDTIITSGEDGRFPKGFVIGTVSEVFEGEEKILKRAKVTPGVDLSRLEDVFVIK